MSLRTDGSHHCDKCDLDIGNGAIELCSRVSDLIVGSNGDTSVVNYEFCRAARTGAPSGCTGLIFGPATLAAYTSSHG